MMIACFIYDRVFASFVFVPNADAVFLALNCCDILMAIVNRKRFDSGKKLVKARHCLHLMHKIYILDISVCKASNCKLLAIKSAFVLIDWSITIGMGKKDCTIFTLT